MANIKYNAVSMISYYGGKGTVQYMEKFKGLLEMAKAENGATTAYDLFGGGAHISLNITDLFNKVIYNEWDKCLTTFFSILKDEKKRDELVVALENIEPSVDSFKYARALWDNAERLDEIGLTDIEKACLPFICAEWSYHGNLIVPDSNKKILDTNKTQNDIQKLLLDEVQNILEVIEIRQGDYWNVMKEHLHDKDAVIILDPPYVDVTRSEHCVDVYPNEFTKEKHIELIERCNTATVPVLICGYDCNLYQEYLNEDTGWTKAFVCYTNQGNTPKEDYVWCRNFKVEI